jgi:hypothetical protein
MRLALFYIVLVSTLYGCSAPETQLLASISGNSGSNLQEELSMSGLPLTACNNVALGKPTNASGSFPTTPSSQAVDGNLGSFWNAGEYPPQWIEINLGSLYSIDEIRLYVSQFPNGNTTHEIWVADASKAYTQVETVTGLTTEGQTLQRIYSPALTSVQWVKIMTTTGPSWVAWYEIEVCQSPAPVNTPTNTPVNTPTNSPTPIPTACENVALGKPANASMSYPVTPPNLAVDGDLTTVWNAGEYAPQWIEIDLGSPISVDEIRLYAAQFPDGNTTHEILVADASKVYTTVETLTGYTSNNQFIQRIYSPALTSVQWVKIMTTVSPSWVAWVEIQVCKTPSGTGTATNTLTSSATGTATNTPTRTPTSTQAGGPTTPRTATPVQSMTGTPTPTRTSTRTPTSTQAGGPTSTFTATSVHQATSTSTRTPTGTPTRTSTNVPTFTATNVSTFTPTSVPTATPLTNTIGKITGGGNLGPDSRNAKGTFGFIVNFRPGDTMPSGNLTYIDHETGMQFRTTSFDSLIIEGTRAVFTGMAIIDGSQEVSFTVEVRDLGEPGTSDWFVITIPELGNYQAGGILTGGNITIH